MSAVQRKQCPRCGRFLPDTARIHWPCVLARVWQQWFVRGPVIVLASLAILIVLWSLLLSSAAAFIPAGAASSASESVSPTTPAALIGETAAAPPTLAASTAVVIVPETFLYDTLGVDARAVRTAALGERFTITAQAESGGTWYQVQTTSGPLWIAAFNVAVAPGGAPIPQIQAVTALPLAVPPTSAPLALPPTFAPATATTASQVVQTTCTATTRAATTLYAGPGIAFTVIDALPTGQTVTLDGQAQDSGGGVWWRVQTSGLWASAASLEGEAGCGSLPFAPVANLPVPTTPAECPGAQPRRLAVGGRARLIDPGGIGLDRAPGSGDAIVRLESGQVVDVIGGPVCAPLGLVSVNWWEVQASPGMVGWVPEEAGGIYYFEPAGS